MKRTPKAAKAPPVNPKYVLTVVDLGELAGILGAMKLSGPQALVGIAQLARWADARAIIGGAATMNLPTFVDAVANVLPAILEANKAQFEALPRVLMDAATMIQQASQQTKAAA